MILLESLALGGLSSALGTAAGSAACAYLARYGVDLTSLTSTNQYFATSHVLRAHLTPGILLAANAVTLVTALAAGLYPAWKAVKLEPVEALRHV
jgi:ABC-type lipoprotein release transport system permease subunit